MRSVKQGKREKGRKKEEREEGEDVMRKACVCSHTLMLLHGQWGGGGHIEFCSLWNVTLTLGPSIA
jgi:hypothetical protein